MVRRSAYLRLLLLEAVLCAVAALLASGLASASDESVEVQTLILEPGDNFVGWVAEPLAVADLFEQIPEAALIYHWDAASRAWRYATNATGDPIGNLKTLEPGMAAKIRISGRESVQWTRPLTPAKGMITLYSGVNWVAWNGRDEWPLDQVARSIGTSLVSIEVRGLAYQQGSDSSETIGPLSGETTIRRGDALRVTVNRDLRWLQPTGMIPNIVWVGDVPQTSKENMTAEIRDLVDYLADTHGVETDFSDTTILIWQTVEDAVAYQASSPQYSFHLDDEALRLFLETVATGAATDWGMFVASSWWRPEPFESIFKPWLAHEWFHYLQIQYTDSWAYGRPPEWLLEGTAVWTGETGVRITDGLQSFGETRRDYLKDAAGSAATLKGAEERNFPWQYRLGLLAVDLLIEEHGTDAMVEYFRRQHPQSVGRERQWESAPSLDEAFQSAFGLKLDDFYNMFEEWRDALPGRRVRDTGDPKLHGSLHDADGKPATGFWVNAVPHEGENEAGRWRRVEVGDDGLFQLSLLPKTVQRLYVSRDRCWLWLTDEGLTTAQPLLGRHRDLDTRNLPILNLTLPEGACENELQLNLLSLRGEDRFVEFLLNSADEWTWTRVSPRPSGTYSGFAPEAGEYRVRAYLDGCMLWYREGGLVPSNGDGQLLVLGEEPVLIELRIPHDLCVRSVSGRLVDQDGAAVEGVDLWMVRGDVSAVGQTSADGSFTITVPDSGNYGLSFWSGAGGCSIFYSLKGATTASRSVATLTIGDEDMTGIEFVVPTDPSVLCR